MGDTWGEGIKLTIFGESHGPAIGIVVDGVPAGEEVDLADITREMARRAPGKSELSTARREPDVVEILSGVWQDKTTGTAICAIIRNKDQRSGDYNTKLRPGHADWTALLKHHGFADMRGGGHFSGRLTAPLVFAGALAKQILGRRGVTVYGRIASVAGIQDMVPAAQPELWQPLHDKAIPVLSEKAEEEMREAILNAKADTDSVGGVVEVIAFGVPGGLGEPFFGSMESTAAALFFSIPAVKGVEFGDGFALAAMRGSAANDELLMQGNTITAATNHNGGILGGITNGMPVTARLAVKPTPSIALPQNSVDAATMQETRLRIRGRHDPCIVPRCVPVAEAALALAILEHLPLNGATP